MPLISDNLSQEASLKKMNEQLGRELSVQRAPVSETSQGMVAFMDENRQSDPFLTGIANSDNPWIPKNKQCLLL